MNKEHAHLVSTLENISPSSRADSTAKSYLNAFNRLAKFTKEFGFQVFPVNLAHMSLYLTSLIEGAIHSQKTKQYVESACYSIQWMHTLAGLPSSTQHPFIKNIVESSRRLLGKPTIKKEPVTASILYSLVELLKHSASLKDIRDLCLYLLAFVGFSRYSDLIGIRSSHIVFNDTHVCITIRSSKHDQYRQDMQSSSHCQNG
ncbi:uncharacterized protein LOC102809078 [Saccoglossus kowalevskii]|uniref:Uncharacterized protein LOC102809078 n=1 Tax=Saccoglossus kowalevskii TaxID=10224 RepID=A0ABM0LZZ4_SACKO|nr:PREDICTED: uncharacterized protein LOC102809078 [Saccoglossus kowalevskii]